MDFYKYNYYIIKIGIKYLECLPFSGSDLAIKFVVCEISVIGFV